MSGRGRTGRASPPLSRDQVDVLIGNVLRYGVLLCALVIAAGVAAAAVRPSRAGGSLSEVVPQLTQGVMVDAAAPPASLGAFLHPASYADPLVLISLGIILLILLPVVRVALTVLIFIVERDRIYVAIATFVLGVLLFGLIFGKAI